MSTDRPFTGELRDAAAPIYDAIVRLPFDVELASGALDVDRFRFYIFQDSPYLADFARALAVTGARAEASDLVLKHLRFAEAATVVERALHASYFAITEHVAAGAAEAVPAPTRGAYVTSSRLEWMFWDSAYRMERWPP